VYCGVLCYWGDRAPVYGPTLESDGWLGAFLGERGVLSKCVSYLDTDAGLLVKADTSLRQRGGQRVFAVQWFRGNEFWRGTLHQGRLGAYGGRGLASKPNMYEQLSMLHYRYKDVPSTIHGTGSMCTILVSAHRYCGRVFSNFRPVSCSAPYWVVSKICLIMILAEGIYYSIQNNVLAPSVVFQISPNHVIESSTFGTEG